MAIPSPRIIIVEENQGIGLLVRASLALLNRRPRLIETPTGDDAWDELQLRGPRPAHHRAGAERVVERSAACPASEESGRGNARDRPRRGNG